MVCNTDNAVLEVKLIDMDWASVLGTARYPPLPNFNTLVWPQGVPVDPGKGWAWQGVGPSKGWILARGEPWQAIAAG